MACKKLFGLFSISRNLSKGIITLLLLESVMTASPAADNARRQTSKTPFVPSTTVESLDVWLESARAQANIPGMAAIVMRSNNILARGVAGVRRTGGGGPVAIQDKFQLGSNTKAITATLVATLVEAGKLSWTTTLADIFPELRDSISAEFRGVTVEQLLSHHGGISPFEDPDDKDFKSIPKLSGTPMERRLAFTAWVLRSKPVVPPGTKGVYSNGGYTIAGAIVERISGKSWESVVSERILTPLGIHGTFAWSDAPDLVQPWGHYETRSGVKAVDPRDSNERVPSIMWPAGAVELSLDDYARFLQLNLRGLEGSDTTLLRSEAIKRLYTSPVTPGDRFALGWIVSEFDGAPAYWHEGSAGAFEAITILLPTLDLAVAVFANAGGERSAKASREALKALARRYARPTTVGKSPSDSDDLFEFA